MRPPRCHNCGRFMELYSADNGTRLYECCGGQRLLPGPEMHRAPKEREVGRR